ncbi:MAG TPA: lysylphosphatidylglycerol synthase transmembrane domain-containing protein [Kofleriaceae bacterium]
MKDLWRRWGWLVRWGGTALGLAYIATVIDLEGVERGFSHLSLTALVAAVVVIAGGVMAGVLRWRSLLIAYHARSVPRLSKLTRLYFIATFYNSYLPTGLVGDIMRGVVSRESFGEHGTTGALAVVFVERALGLFAVFVLVMAGLLAAGATLGDHQSLWWWSIIGVAGALACVLALPFGRKVAPFLPAPLAAVAERLPSVTRPLQFGSATLLSLATQLAMTIAGWLLLRDLDPSVSFNAALLVVPLAAATSYLPITISGVGAREAVFVALCGRLFGMPANDAVAASLMLWLVILIVAAVGGVWQIASRKSLDPGVVVEPPPGSH